MPYITHVFGLVYGVGSTAKAALADAKRTLSRAQIVLLDDKSDPADQLGSWMRARDYTPCPAAWRLPRA